MLKFDEMRSGIDAIWTEFYACPIYIWYRQAYPLVCHMHSNYIFVANVRFWYKMLIEDN